VSAPPQLAHHELCFGCGNANLFGLQMELEQAGGGPASVTGRFFVKQDHQGPEGVAHGGILASALDEAMAIALHAEGVHARTRRLEVDLLAAAPVGAFLRVDARVERREPGKLWLSASARGVGEGARTVAEARGLFVELAG
jgi:acyl-coenzyme A thioesterase PaaI-like protein